MPAFTTPLTDETFEMLDQLVLAIEETGQLIITHEDKTLRIMVYVETDPPTYDDTPVHKPWWKRLWGEKET